MQKAESRFNVKLTQKDREILEIFRIRLQLAKITEFSSDHFRMLDLDHYYRGQVSTLFAKAVIHKIIERVGRTQSTRETRHGASIGLYMFADETE